jgi:hypothetical protein
LWKHKGVGQRFEGRLRNLIAKNFPEAELTKESMAGKVNFTQAEFSFAGVAHFQMRKLSLHAVKLCRRQAACLFI